MDSFLDKEGLLGLCCSDQEMVETLRAGTGTKCELTTLKRAWTLASSRIFSGQSHGIRLWGEDGSRKLANVQQSPPQARALRPDKKLGRNRGIS